MSNLLIEISPAFVYTDTIVKVPGDPEVSQQGTGHGARELTGYQMIMIWKGEYIHSAILFKSHSEIVKKYQGMLSHTEHNMG